MFGPSADKPAQIPQLRDVLEVGALHTNGPRPWGTRGWGRANPLVSFRQRMRVESGEEATHQGKQALLSLAQVLVQVPRQPEHGGKPRCVAAVAAVGRLVPWVARCRG